MPFPFDQLTDLVQFPVAASCAIFDPTAGYSHIADPFGFRGTAFTVADGALQTVTVDRTHPAERLYRLTGAQTYQHSVAVGAAVPITHPILNSGVVGQDSVQAALHGDQIVWFFGDTNRQGYPLGNFYTTGATSPAAGARGALLEVNLTYFGDGNGFVSPMAPPSLQQPAAPNGPVWVGGLTSLSVSDGLVTVYAKVDSAMAPQWWGAMRWDPAASRFAELGARWNASHTPALYSAGGEVSSFLVHSIDR
jgi:hypothetical protein